ncbi:MAG: NADH-quinone oxidoreductase subunit NuoF [Alphaproteobacteria bacterium]|nr:MAG: NADH-quinone oxidoreductase subunit NuoF [Alphaproteobacteria bacterium]
MIRDEDRIFTNLFGQKPVTLEAAQARGDWVHTRKNLQRSQESIQREITQSGLRGRGGAAFSTGRKWGFVPKDTAQPKYLIVNADESEPGACKDREILRHEPYKLLEGALLAAYAIGAKVVYVYIRGEYAAETKVIQRAVDELYAQKLLGENILDTGVTCHIHIHQGAGAYICGEESALLESLEGRRGLPRRKPPFPAISGLYGCPTIVNNVETLAQVPAILKRGAGWFAGLGTAHSAGTKIFSISGHVNNPCNVEEVLGIPLRELIDTYAGGVTGGWSNLLAVIPGGTSMPLLPKNICDTLTMDYESLQEVQSGLGTASVIVLNRTVDIVDALVNVAGFYAHESCGQCSPCREGTGWMLRVLTRLKEGRGHIRDLDNLQEVTEQIAEQTICAFGEAAAWPIQGLLRHFKHDLEARLGADVPGRVR